MKSYVRIVKSMFSSGKKIILWAFIVLMMVIALEMAIPLGINRMLSLVETDRSVKEFLLGVLVFIAAYLLLAFLTSLNMKLYIRIGNRLLWNLREKIYEVLWRANYLKEIQGNKDRFKFVLATQTYKAFAIAVIYTLGGLADFLTLVAFLIISFIYSVPVGTVLVLSILVTTLVSFSTGKAILTNYEKSSRAQEEDNAQVLETVELCEVTRTNGLEEYYLKKNKSVHDKFMNLSEKAEGKSSFCEAIERGLHSLIYIVVAGVLLLTKDASAGSLVTILFVTNLAIEVSGRVQRELQVIIKNIPAFGDVVSLMDVEPESGDVIDSVETISLKGVGFSVDERDIFKGVNVEICKGDNVCIKGENGSGKSSLLKILIGIYEPTEGFVLINGKDIREYDTTSFFKDICYVSQDELLLNESVEDYLREISHTPASDDIIYELRKRLKLNPEIKEIVENGSGLSGGEKKKLFIIKSLLRKNASVVIFDEVDAGLDDETKVTLKNIENELLNNKEKTVIKISHIDSDSTGYNKIIKM